MKFYNHIKNFLSIGNKQYNQINIEIPNYFMNCGVTINNNFIADTNNSENFHILKFPLPKPNYKWNIDYFKYNTNKFKTKIVVLIDKP